MLRNAGRRTSTHFIRIAALGSQISQARTKLEVIRQIAAIVEYQVAQIDLSFATGMLLGASGVSW